MFRNLVVAGIIVCLQLCAFSSSAQCLTAPALEPCEGTEPLLTDNETLLVGTKKWFYGGTATYNSITLRGGALIVCGDLTVNNFTMDSGMVVIRPGARFRIATGAGVILRGNSSIYNHGTFECTANLSLDATWATAEKPNVVINATSTSLLKMGNQYFVINNPYSFFVNRGKAEFWGLITDFNAGPNSVCLGRYSEMRMAVLYNNRSHTYIAPEGAACVNVYQYSQFRDTLTNSMSVNICLGAAHTSDACGACKPNAWGTPNIFNVCDQCAGLELLRKDNKTQPRNSIPESSAPSITIGPNPFDRELSFRWKGESPREIELYNLSGVKMYSLEIKKAGNQQFNWQVPAGLPAGNYFVKMVFEKKVVVRQVVRIH